MKKIILIIVLSVFNVHASSLDCSLTKNYKEEVITLTQDTYAEDDPEEESESYSGKFNKDSVVATVLYLPYQTGVDLYLEQTKLGVQASTNFDLYQDDYMGVDLLVGTNLYSLTCLKIK